MKKILYLLSINILTITLFAACTTKTMAQNVRVRVFSTCNITSLTLTPSFGAYTLNDSIKLNKSNKVNISVNDCKIAVSLNDKTIAKTDSVKISSEDLKCFVQITPDNVKPRRYDNNIIIKLDVAKKNLIIINDVSQDNYLAGVVQSEAGGASDNVEFFKVQAICCRSYMYRFINKHAKDGYNLCDDVNCQVYLSRANKPQCIEGAASTNGEIIVDENDKIIETLFHSNSGGQTSNSEDVWSNKIPYLRSVVDSFSLNMPNAKWEKEITQKQWLNYFKGKGINTKKNKDELLSFSQSQGRKTDILGVPLTQIRKDFNLKSTYFDVIVWGSNIKLKGRGYGHGVGMSQEGAVNMCESGYEYWEVIEFYYKDVKIKNLNKDS